MTRYSFYQYVHWPELKARKLVRNAEYWSVHNCVAARYGARGSSFVSRCYRASNSHARTWTHPKEQTQPLSLLLSPTVRLCDTTQGSSASASLPTSCMCVMAKVQNVHTGPELSAGYAIQTNSEVYVMIDPRECPRWGYKNRVGWSSDP